MQVRLALGLFWLFVWSAGSTSSSAPAVCQATAVSRGLAQRVDRAQLMADVQALSDVRLEGRGTGTAGGRQAQRWVVESFTAIGLQPAGTAGFLQPFALNPAGGAADAANVVGLRQGTAPGIKALVVSAHYDHLGSRSGRVFPGADDNASGVAVMLAVARHLAAQPPRHPVYFVAFDAEERGLRGAKAFVEAAPAARDRFALNVNLDMVSRSDRREIFVAGTSHAPWLRPILDPVRQRSTVTVRYGHDVPGRARDDWTLLSDHGAFHRAGVPFVYFGVEDHADYHRPSDSADKIDPAFFGAVADTIVEAVVTLDAAIP